MPKKADLIVITIIDQIRTFVNDNIPINNQAANKLCGTAIIVMSFIKVFKS